MFGKKQRGAVARQPHPDPAVELKLQRIENLQATVRRYADLVSTLRSNIASANYAANSSALNDRSSDSVKVAETVMNRTNRMYEQLRETEQDIQRTQDLIIEFSEGLSDTDLSYLTGG